MKKSLTFKVKFFEHKWPVIAAGFLFGGREFIVCLWLVTFRLAWEY